MSDQHAIAVTPAPAPAPSPAPNRAQTPITRIAIIGCSGAGKSTLGARLGAGLKVPHVELDGLFHGPDWTPSPDFETDVARVVDTDGWVVDGNYRRTRDLVWNRVQLVVALDLSWRVTVGQTINRTLRRIATRQELWNGNRENWSNLAKLDPHYNIVLWSATQHRRYRRQLLAEMTNPRWVGLPIVRLTTRTEINQWASAFIRRQQEAAITEN